MINLKAKSLALSVVIATLSAFAIIISPARAQIGAPVLPDLASVTFADIGLDYYYILRRSSVVQEQGTVWPQMPTMGGPITLAVPVGSYTYELYREDGFIEYGQFTLTPGQLVIVTSTATTTKVSTQNGGTTLSTVTDGIVAEMGSNVGLRISAPATVTTTTSSSVGTVNENAIPATSVTEYTVQPGDTIGAVATAFGHDPKVLLAINPILSARAGNELIPGEIILIPGVFNESQTVAGPAVAQAPPPAPAAAPANTSPSSNAVVADNTPPAGFTLGDVLCIDPANPNPDALVLCTTPGSPLVTAVAGADGQSVLVGTASIKVSGPVQVGDFLVASSIPGVAVVNNNPAPGTVIAQALEVNPNGTAIVRALIRKF